MAREGTFEGHRDVEPDWYSNFGDDEPKTRVDIEARRPPRERPAPAADESPIYDADGVDVVTDWDDANETQTVPYGKAVQP